MTTITKILMALVVAILVSGCVNSEPTYTASGQKGHSIDCSGDLGTWGDCYEEAGELCGARGYKVLEKMTDKGSSVIADKDGLFGDSTNTRSLIIQCK